MTLAPDAGDTIEAFFKALGYTVSYGGLRTGERWCEVFEGGRRMFQISLPAPPVAELIVDLPHLLEGRAGVGPTAYWRACDDDDKLRELLSRVRAAEEKTA